MITAKCAPNLRHGKAEARTAMYNLDDYDIVKAHTRPNTGASSSATCSPPTSGDSRARAGSPRHRCSRRWTAKQKSTVSKVAAKHKTVVETPHGKRTCFEARVDRDGKQPLVARFGGIPLARRKDATLVDRVPDSR